MRFRALPAAAAGSNKKKKTTPATTATVGKYRYTRTASLAAARTIPSTYMFLCVLTPVTCFIYMTDATRHFQRTTTRRQYERTVRCAKRPP